MVEFLRTRPWVLILSVNLIAVLLLELLVRLLAFNGLIPYRYYPTSKQRTLLDDIHPHFGVWRYPNKSVYHGGACFGVSYRTNSHGMRDEETSFQRKGKEQVRAIVLGDSFVEGFGVEEHLRFTELSEAETGIEMLNFGTSGDFSSTQQFLVYKHLAKNFEHDLVLLYFLPANDFRDNDPKFFPPNRYRPYLQRVGSEDEFDIYYPVAFEERERDRGMSFMRSLRREFYNRSYLLNAFRQFGDIFESSKLKDAVTDQFLSQLETSYDDYSEEDLQKLVWGYRQIAQEAAPRPLKIFIIPREVDFLQAERGVYHAELPERLKALLSDYPNVKIIDLLPRSRKILETNGWEHDELFLPCDGHWSTRGHEVASSVLSDVLAFFQGAPSASELGEPLSSFTEALQQLS